MIAREAGEGDWIPEMARPETGRGIDDARPYFLLPAFERRKSLPPPKSRTGKKRQPTENQTLGYNLERLGISPASNLTYDPVAEAR